MACNDVILLFSAMSGNRTLLVFRCMKTYALYTIYDIRDYRLLGFECTCDSVRDGRMHFVFKRRMLGIRFNHVTLWPEAGPRTEDGGRRTEVSEVGERRRGIREGVVRRVNVVIIGYS